MTQPPLFIGTEEEFVAIFGKPMTKEEEAIADAAVLSMISKLSIDQTIGPPRYLTREEMDDMERLTKKLDDDITAALKGRPRVYTPKSERDG